MDVTRTPLKGAKKEEGRRKKESVRRKKEEGRRKKKEGSSKKEAVRRKEMPSYFVSRVSVVICVLYIVCTVFVPL